MLKNSKIRAARLPALLLLAFCCMSAGACAADSTPPPPSPQMQARFEEMDTNNDGKVVIEEFNAAFPNMNERAFMVIDKNGDKGIERSEWYEFVDSHGRPPSMGQRGAPMNNIPGDPMIPPPDSNDLPLVRPPLN